MAARFRKGATEFIFDSETRSGVTVRHADREAIFSVNGVIIDRLNLTGLLLTDFIKWKQIKLDLYRSAYPSTNHNNI